MFYLHTGKETMINERWRKLFAVCFNGNLSNSVGLVADWQLILKDDKSPFSSDSFKNLRSIESLNLY